MESHSFLFFVISFHYLRLSFVGMQYWLFDRYSILAFESMKR